MLHDHAKEDPFNIKCVDYQTTAMEAVSQLGHSSTALWKPHKHSRFALSLIAGILSQTSPKFNFNFNQCYTLRWSF